MTMECRSRFSPASRFTVSSLVMASPNETPTVLLSIMRTFTSCAAAAVKKGKKDEDEEREELK